MPKDNNYNELHGEFEKYEENWDKAQDPNDPFTFENKPFINKLKFNSEVTYIDSTGGMASVKKLNDAEFSMLLSSVWQSCITSVKTANCISSKKMYDSNIKINSELKKMSSDILNSAEILMIDAHKLSCFLEKNSVLLSKPMAAYSRGLLNISQYVIKAVIEAFYAIDATIERNRAFSKIDRANFQEELKNSDKASKTAAKLAIQIIEAGYC